VIGSHLSVCHGSSLEQVITKKISLESKPLSKVEKTVKTLLQKKIEEQENLNYTLLGSFKVPLLSGSP
jgi:F0F1-type ATP synthase delta subunit